MHSEMKENQREVQKAKYTVNWAHFSGNERKPKGCLKGYKRLLKMEEVFIIKCL